LFKYKDPDTFDGNTYTDSLVSWWWCPLGPLAFPAKCCS